MADVFLSYAQEDRTRARQLADALRELGWDVWWDAHVYVGTRFRSEITRQLQSAKCVVVLWSQASIESDWVIDEAQDGKNRGVLVQALIDDVPPPHGFRGIQWANLNSWSGDIKADEFIKLADGISRFAQAPTSISSRVVDTPQQDSPAHITLEAREQTPTARRIPLLWRIDDSVARWTAAVFALGMVIAVFSMRYVEDLPAEQPPQMAQLTSDKPVAASSSSAAPAANTAPNANGRNVSAPRADRATSAERPSSPPSSPATASASGAKVPPSAANQLSAPANSSAPVAVSPANVVLAIARQWLDAYHRQDRNTMAALSTDNLLLADERRPDERFPTGLSDVTRALDRVSVQIAAADTAVLTAVLTEKSVSQPSAHVSGISLMWVGLREGQWKLRQARFVNMARYNQEVEDCPPVGIRNSLWFDRDQSLSDAAKSVLQRIATEAKRNDRSIIHITVYSTRTGARGTFSDPDFSSQMVLAVFDYLDSQGILLDRRRTELKSVPSGCNLGSLVPAAGRVTLEVR